MMTAERKRHLMDDDQCDLQLTMRKSHVTVVLLVNVAIMTAEVGEHVLVQHIAVPTTQ